MMTRNLPNIAWHISEVGDGRVIQGGNYVDLYLPASDAHQYHDAQLTDYNPQAPRFAYRPPLRMTIRARVMTPIAHLRGTAGFGFWNHPFAPGQRRLRLPSAIWFFFSAPPSNISLALGVAGHGWKCATFESRSWAFAALLPFAPLGFLLMRVPALYKRLWPLGQRAIGVNEHMLDVTLLAQSRQYTIEWRQREAHFFLDEQLLYRAPTAPRGPLGFITWIDNQYAIVSPQGRFGAGLVALPQEQKLRIESVSIQPLQD